MCTDKLYDAELDAISCILLREYQEHGNSREFRRLLRNTHEIWFELDVTISDLLNMIRAASAARRPLNRLILSQMRHG